jgi:HSP20 family protein
MLSFPEVNELSEDVRRLFEELDRLHGPSCRGLAGIYTPALDVFETAETVEVFVDLPGVTSQGVRVIFKNGAFVIAGEKMAPDGCGDEGTAYHLVERGFGRFARVIRLVGPTEATRARATMCNGELHISVPRIAERRGREIVVLVEELT